MPDQRCSLTIGVLGLLGAIGCAPTESADTASEATKPTQPAAETPPATPDGPKAAPPRVDPPPGPQAQILPGDRRAFVFLRSTDDRHARLWKLGADGKEQELPHQVDFPRGGTSNVGTTGPLLSWDGSTVAFLLDGDIVVAPTEGGSPPHRIPAKGKGGRVELLLAGFSGDGRSLLFHRDEVRDMEPVPLPEGAKLGFMKLSLRDKTEQTIDTGGFSAWTHDGKNTLWVESTLDKSTLWKQPVPTGNKSSLAEATGISQVAFNGLHYAYVRSVMGSSNGSTIMWGSLDGSDTVPLTEPAGFAMLQWPHPSPDNTRVAFCQRRVPRDPSSDLKVVEVAKPKAATTMFAGPSGDCDFAWLTSDTFVALDDNVLHEVKLDGTTTVLAKDVVGLAAAGEAK